MSLLRLRASAGVLSPLTNAIRVETTFKRHFTSQDSSIPASIDRESDPNKPPSEKSAMMRHSDSSQALIDHDRLDYTAHVDHGTSLFSPTPRRVVDGSEETGSVAAAVLSGAPIDLQARTVRIYRPTKSAMQSGTWHQHAWQLDWDVLPKGHRWENPLMGWQSSADFMQGTKMKFKTKEDAIKFAEKQGYECPGPLKKIPTK